MNTEKYEVAAQSAASIATWLATRGGILVWQSADLSHPGQSVTTPANGADGQPTGKPGWQYASEPRKIVSADEVVVYTTRVIREIPAKLKRSGYKLVLTDACDRKVRLALDEAGEGSFYRFASTQSGAGDLGLALSGGQDQVQICVPDVTVPLAQWLSENPISSQ